MAEALDLVVPAAAKRILVVAENPWLRQRLQRELTRRECQVVVLSRLEPGAAAPWAGYDAVLIDAALFPEGTRLEALRALRSNSPQAQFVLLVGPGDHSVAEQAQQSAFDLVRERPADAEALSEVAREALGPRRPPAEPVPVAMGFEFLVETPRDTGTRRARSALTSLVVHAVLLTLGLLIPLLYTERIEVREVAGTWLVVPPRPPPPAPEEEVRAGRRIQPVLQTATGKLIAPTLIPKEVSKIVEPTDVPLDIDGIRGGVRGGVPGGQLGGVIGSVLGSLPRTRPVPPAPVSQKPIRVGGRVRPPQLLKRVEAVYPPIAKQARIQGVVRINAVIDTQGRVQQVEVISGHPLLVPAALTAVRQWVYEPTYVNEQPVPVVVEVRVHFRLFGAPQRRG